jgi:hypothetical protein
VSVGVAFDGTEVGVVGTDVDTRVGGAEVAAEGTDVTMAVGCTAVGCVVIGEAPHPLMAKAITMKLTNSLDV